MKQRVGILGAGQAGERHAAGFAMTDGAVIVGVADSNEARAQKLARQVDAAPFSDWRELLSTGLDILVVSLPHNLHVEPAEAAAAQGIHLLMEKPIATTLSDGHRIVDACRNAGVKLTISFVHRYREEVRAAKRWLDQGLLGTPRLVRETMGGQHGKHLPTWVEQKAIAGGGVMMYSAIHSIDRLRWLLASEVVGVTARTHRFNVEEEVEAGVAALIDFADGASVVFSASAPRYRAQPAWWETEIYGTTGLLRVRTRHWAELSTDHQLEHLDTEQLSETAGPHYNFARQAQSFLTAIREDRPPEVSGEDGLRALEIVHAIYSSAERGERVVLLEP